MKEIAQMLLDTMDVCKKAKMEKKPGNYQGVANQIDGIFKTIMRQESGRTSGLNEMIVKAQNLRHEVSRIHAGSVVKASGPTSGGEIDMAAAFDLQRAKKKLGPGHVAMASVIKGSSETIEIKNEVPPTEEKPEEVEVPDVEDPDSNLLSTLAGLSPAELKDHFGGMDGLKGFCYEVFAKEWEEGTNWRTICKEAKQMLVDKVNE